MQNKIFACLNLVYPVDIAIIPTYKPKKLLILNSIIAENKTKWLEEIENEVIAMTARQYAGIF